eukprot:GDKH01003062.1.p1 GENE.GDKH01003062.1~~GDKH01003062.1.p1  ORF type:complete len:248 (-),score=39.38 GDKH01003062.1:89-832(-)
MATHPTPEDLMARGSSLSFVCDILGVLKRIKRTGWLMRNVPFPESDSDHMHRCAMCTMLLDQPPHPSDDYSGENARFLRVDKTRLLRMALTHDVCESLAGDITPFCDPGKVASKASVEQAAMEKIREVVGDPLGLELFELWKEYEEQDTTEAIVCKDIDKFEMVVQAFEYEREHLKPKPEGKAADEDSVAARPEAGAPSVHDEPMRRFYETTKGKMRSPLFKRLDAELRARRAAMLASKGWAVTERE